MEQVISSQGKKYSIKSIVSNRELLYFLVWRDIKVHYKQTTVGILWAILHPFITMIAFSFLFGTVAKIETGKIPYPIFVYTGLLFWNLFSRSVLTSVDVLVANQNLIKKVYFPKLTLVIAATLVTLVDFVFAGLMLFILMFYFQYVPRFTSLLIIPLAVVITLMFSIGLGSFLAALNVAYRDVRFIVSYALQIFMFATPVVYPPSAIEGKYQIFLLLNPLTGIIENVRAGTLGTKPIDFSLLGISLLLSFCLFVVGINYFRRQEKYFADLV